MVCNPWHAIEVSRIAANQSFEFTDPNYDYVLFASESYPTAVSASSSKITRFRMFLYG